MAINRKNDYAFKRIFGHEDSKDILARFLTVVLDVPIEPGELTLAHTEFSPEYLADKSSTLDIQVRRSEHHEKLNVEMQIGDEGNIGRRILYYWSKGYAEDLKEGQGYETLPRMISIVIMDFDVFEWEDERKFHGVFRVTEADEGNLFSDALEIHTLELPKLRRQQVKEDWEALVCWCLYLDNMEGKVMEQIAEKEPMIKRAMTVEDLFTKNEEERRFYELREKGRRDYEGVIRYSVRQGRLEGRQEGLQEGRQEGLREGRLEGIAEGARKVGRAMLARGMSPDQIAQITGFSVEEIEALRETDR